jgi:putative Mg2+ transporter-C (MgtC) family protein
MIRFNRFGPLQTMDGLQHALVHHYEHLADVLSVSIVRLMLAALLGGAIGLERQLRHKPAGLRTNMFICFGAAMFTVMSDQLAGSLGGDHTRVAAQIIPGIGFIGAGSILHARGSVTGLTTAATLFVVAAVGMAAGGGLYLTAVFATGVILVALALLGKVETHFSLKAFTITYEVVGKSAEVMLDALDRILEQEHLSMRNLRAVSADRHARIVFGVESDAPEHQSLNIRLRESSAFANVNALGSIEHE